MKNLGLALTSLRNLLITLCIGMFCTSPVWAAQWTVLGPDGGDVRSLAYNPHNPDQIFLGTSTGSLFVSNDGGHNWARFARLGTDDYVLDHIAVDPQNPKKMFVSAWSVANQQAGDLFRTHDGGKNWEALSGMHGKSIRAMAIAASDSKVIVAGALDGVYRSNDSIVYAGTTEGLWKTMDQGKTWKRVSNPEVVVNDVLVDPRNSQRVLLATDRSGVLASDDGTQSFSASNHGYTHRYVTSILADQKDANTIYVGLVNDREWGGVFYSQDGGTSWLQKSTGLGGRDVFALKQTKSGALVAGTNRGILMLDRNSSAWRPINTVVVEKTVTRPVKKGSKRTVASKSITRSVLEARVSDIEIAGDRWIAATSAGLFTSTDQGKMWKGGPVLGEQDFISVDTADELVVAATRSSVVVSTDTGKTWKEARLASYKPNVRNVTVTPDGQILVASREGAFSSADSGTTWEHMLAGLPDKDLTSIAYDESHKRLLATSSATGVIFESTDGGRRWRRGPDSGFPLRRINVVHGRLLAATPFDGVIAQPENESQSASAEGSGGN